MTTLRYDDHEDAYLGQYLRVDAGAFGDAVDELVGGGMEEQEAMLTLLQEDEWSPDMEGVELLLSEDLAVEAAQRIVRGRP